MSANNKQKKQLKGTIMAKTDKRGANKARNQASPAINLESMNYWRELAKTICPNIDDDYELGEVAVALQQFCKIWNVEQKTISKICNKNEDTKISVGFGVVIDRRTTPSEVAVKVSYAEKHALSFKCQVPDPNQDELPGITEGNESPEEPAESETPAEQ